MKALLIEHLVPVRVARTEAEREAVFRHRYQIYVEELNKAQVDNADHVRRMIRDPEDDREDTRLFYTGPTDAPTGSVRCELYRPGTLPVPLIHKFSLDAYPELLDEAISIIRYMITSPGVRGGMIPASFTIAGFEWTARGHASRLSFSTAPPAVVLAYRKVGYRPYAARLVETPDGVRVPVVNVWSDHAYHRAHGSPLVRRIRRTFGARGHAPLDIARYRGRIDDDAGAFRLDPRAIRDALRPVIRHAGARVFEGLQPRDAAALASVATVMDVQAGQTLYRRGLHDQELYIVLSGALELRHDGRAPVRCQEGDPLGAVAMLSPRGRRVATAVACEASSLLVLRRSALRRLSQRHPTVGATLTLNLARWLAASVDELLDERQAPCVTASLTSTISPPPSGDACSTPHPSSRPGRPASATGTCWPSTM